MLLRTCLFSESSFVFWHAWLSGFQLHYVVALCQSRICRCVARNPRCKLQYFLLSFASGKVTFKLDTTYHNQVPLRLIIEVSRFTRPLHINAAAASISSASATLRLPTVLTADYRWVQGLVWGRLPDGIFECATWKTYELKMTYAMSCDARWLAWGCWSINPSQVKHIIRHQRWHRSYVYITRTLRLRECYLRFVFEKIYEDVLTYHKARYTIRTPKGLSVRHQSPLLDQQARKWKNACNVIKGI